MGTFGRNDACTCKAGRSGRSGGKERGKRLIVALVLMSGVGVNSGFSFPLYEVGPTDQTMRMCGRGSLVPEDGSRLICGPMSAAPLAVETPPQQPAGAEPPAPVQVLPTFSWPADGPITSYFGEVAPTSPRGHAGLDIAPPYGAPVLAAAAGLVVEATTAGGPYGIMAVLDHGDGFTTLYAHLSRLSVEIGQQVEPGQPLGLIGSTGYSTGPHLHFELRQHGTLIDPLELLP
jgi:murein DD-endopeptidase MepM/ murein hydrolase activator NlpD